MTAETSRVEQDAFGVGGKEGLLRRLVAVTIAVGLFAGAFSIFFISPTSTWAVVAAYLLLLPSSYGLERRWPGRPGRPSLVRYGLVGALLGLVAVVVVLQALPTRGWAAMGIGVGAVAAALGVKAATALPTRWLVPAGVLATALVGIAAIS